MNDGVKVSPPLAIVIDPPNDTAVPLMVMAELVRLELPILLSVLLLPEMVLLVNT